MTIIVLKLWHIIMWLSTKTSHFKYIYCLLINKTNISKYLLC